MQEISVSMVVYAEDLTEQQVWDAFIEMCNTHGWQTGGMIIKTPDEQSNASVI